MNKEYLLNIIENKPNNMYNKAQNLRYIMNKMRLLLDKNLLNTLEELIHLNEKVERIPAENGKLRQTLQIYKNIEECGDIGELIYIWEQYPYIINGHTADYYCFTITEIFSKIVLEWMCRQKFIKLSIGYIYNDVLSITHHKQWGPILPLTIQLIYKTERNYLLKIKNYLFTIRYIYNTTPIKIILIDLKKLIIKLDSYRTPWEMIHSILHILLTWLILRLDMIININSIEGISEYYKTYGAYSYTIKNYIINKELPEYTSIMWNYYIRKIYKITLLSMFKRIHEIMHGKTIYYNLSY